MISRLQKLRKLANVRAPQNIGAQTNSGVLTGFPIVLTVVLCAVSALAWSGIFPSSALIIPTVVALIAVSIVAWLARRQSAVTCLALAFGVVFFTAHVTVLRVLSTGGIALPSSRSLRVFGDAFRNGWSRILTSPIPMNLDVDRSLVFLIVVVLGTSTGLYFAVRQRALPACMVGPGVIALTARLYGANTSAPWAAIAAAIGVGVAILAAMSAGGRSATSGRKATTQWLNNNEQRKKQDSSSNSDNASADRTKASPASSKRALLGFRGQAVTAFALTSVLGATIAGAGLVATKKRLGEPYDPRRVAPLQNDDELAIDPLSYVPYWAQNGKQKLFTTTAGSATNSAGPAGSAGVVPNRWRIAVLDSFDGSRWLPNTRYTETGSLLPAPPPGTGIDTNAPTITANVTLDDLPERWLPVPGWPTEITGTAVSLDQEHGVVLQRRARTGVTADPNAEPPEVRYRVKAIPLLAQPPTKLDGFATNKEARENLATPKIPPDLTNIAQTIASSATSPRERVALIETYLRSFYQFNPAAQPGHSYARIERLLRDQGAKGEGGTSEQFAVAFAMLARSLGIPTRVVVGFVVQPEAVAAAQQEAPNPTVGDTETDTETDTGSGTASFTVTAADARAWPEVLFANVGWVPFDPTPAIGATTREPKPEPAGGNEPAATTTVPDTVPDTIAEEITPTVEATKSWSLAPWILGFLVVALGVLGLVGAAWFVVRKRRAKRRLQNGRQAIYGAWHEATRSLAACQQRISAADTLNDYTVRTVSAERFRTLNEPLTTMAKACEKSQFGAEEPTTAEIAEAWAASDHVLQHVRDTATPKEKALILLDIRK